MRRFFSKDNDSDADDMVSLIETADGKLMMEGDGEVSREAQPVVNGAAVKVGELDAGEIDRVSSALVKREVIDSKVLRESAVEWKRTGRNDVLWRVIARHPHADRDAVYAEAARIYAFDEAEVSQDKLDAPFIKRVVAAYTNDQQDTLFSLRLLPYKYEIDGDRGVLKLLFATHDPTRPETLKFIHELKLEHFELRYAPESELLPIITELFPRRNEYLEKLSDDASAEAFDLGAVYDQEKSRLVDEEALDAEINRSSLINLFEAALVEAVRQGVSDIHIFPNSRKQTEIHFRIDGELQLWHTQDKVHPEAMLAVVKDRCGNVDRFEREAAQDGFIQRTVDDTLIRYRVSVLPVATTNRDVKSESIVIRVLDDRKVFSELSAIGLLPGALERFQKAVKQPHGMIIMTGPTGSGKSTTLVAALQSVVRPQINALSVEDPVEYIIPGVRQIKLGTRLDFDQAIRSILRHDPDIVMVGEMRDRPTAELAIKLANTGHLTFSTLHTNDAPSAVSRLYKMGIEPFLLAYAINLVVAQRLLRKLCPTCKVEDKSPDRVLMKHLGFSEEEIDGVHYRAGDNPNCRTCKGVGYKGRRAIAEALYFSREIRHLVVEAGEAIDEDAIRDQAIKEGMLTLSASAREVVRLGETSVEEMLRVTAME